MTDDEAFLRGIVAAPGDDVPRLVYADCLDERDDPRGAYLRAELAWAEPWKRGERPDDSPALRAMATTLDRLWVARVSRPPLGVCCDHSPFEDGGPQVTAEDLRRFEQHHGVTLPVQYAAFLLNANGGAPDCFRFDTPSGYGANGDGWLDVRYFRVLRAHQQKGKPHKPVEVVARQFDRRMTRKYLIIADADSERGTDRNTIHLGLSGSEVGMVFDHYRAGEADPNDEDEWSWVGDSFLAFFSNLRAVQPDEEGDWRS